jgi:LacI family transcriptional regulator
MKTMYDIAAKAGVSQATVSHVINNRTEGVRISTETRQRILQIAEEMGYRKNELARAMSTGKNSVLGILLSDSEMEHQGRIVGGVLAEANGYEYLMKTVPVPMHNYETVIKRCIEWRLAGIIATHLYEDALLFLHKEMSRWQVPIVVANDDQTRDWGISVVSHDSLGVREAIEHLVELGHRRIGFLAAERESPVSERRLEAYRKALAEKNILVPESYVAHGHWAISEVTEQAARQLLENRVQRPTAILCAGDPLALILYRIARTKNLSIPEELSVVGFGGLYLTPYVDPPLTTVSQPFQEIGRSAVRQLLSRINSSKGQWNDSPLREALPTDLVIRSSTAPAAG